MALLMLHIKPVYLKAYLEKERKINTSEHHCIIMLVLKCF